MTCPAPWIRSRSARRPARAAGEPGNTSSTLTPRTWPWTNVFPRMPRYAFPAETVELGSAGTVGMLSGLAEICCWGGAGRILCWLTALAPRASRPRTIRPGKSHQRTTTPGTMPLTWCTIASQHRCHRTYSHRISASPTPTVAVCCIPSWHSLKHSFRLYSRVLTAIELDPLQYALALAPEVLRVQLEISDNLG